MTVRNVLIDIVGRDKASPAFLKSAAAADTAAGRIIRSGQKMQAAGATLTKSLTLPFVAVAAVSVKAAADYQKQLTLLQTAGGELQKNMGVVSAGIKKVASSTGTSLSQLTEGAYTVEKAGVRGANMLKVLQASAEGAKAENVDLGIATNALTSVMMSYHLAASDAVKVENQLIVGAGMAKTTMQEYAGSLATVVPIASAAGIKFDQIAGAIATLTQHGTSAQEATQELAFTIRNLQAPNNVAVSAMNQLGISAVDVSKNLGKRGLTGTLQFIESKLPKSGLVYLNTMKQMEAGSTDLNAMLAKMPKSLKTLSKGFLDGKVSFADYRKAYRGFGAEGAAQGQQFAVLAQKVKGYNDDIKRGTPSQKTMAAMLKQIYGGAVGLNTALQLSGENMAYFKRATNDVAKAAKESGTHVHGWAKTQATLSQQLDETKSSAHNIAVDLGNELIPALNKLLKWVQKGIDWFDGLSRGTKKWILIVGGASAALGPVLAILGRLLKGFGLLWKAGAGTTRFLLGLTGARRAMATTETSATVMGAKVRGVFTGVADAAVASSNTVIAAQERQAAAMAGAARVGGMRIAGSAAVAARGTAARGVAGAAPVIVPAAGGAAARSGLGRGAVLGAGLGVMVGGQFLAGAIDDHKAGSGRNIAAGAVGGAATGALLGSVLGPWGMLGGAALGGVIGGLKNYISGLHKVSAGMKDYKSLAKNDAKITDAFSKALQAGTKGLAARRQVAAQEALGQTNLAKRAAAAGLTQKDLTNAVTGSNAAYQKLIETWRASGKPSEDTLGALQKLRDQYLAGNEAAKKYADVHGLALQSEVKTVPVVQLLTGKLGNLNTANLTAAQTQQIFNNRLSDVTRSVKENGRTLDTNTSYGQKNIAAIRAAAAESIAHAQAVYKQTGNLKLADKALQSDRTELLKTATRAGLTKADVKKLSDQLSTIPKNPKSTIHVDIAAAKRTVSTFQTWFDNTIASMSGKTIPVYVQPTGMPASGGGLIPKMGSAPTGGGLIPTGPHARGGGVKDGWFSVGEQGYELGYKRGNKVEIFSNSDSRRMTGLNRLPGYASGTKPNTERIATAIGVIGQAYTKPIDVQDVGYNRIAAQIRNAVNVLNQEIRKGLSRASTASFRHEITSLTAEAHAQLATLRKRISGSDMSAVRAALKQTVDDTRDAVSKMLTDLWAAAVPTATRNLVANLGRRLEGAQGRLLSAKTALSAMGDYRSNIRSTLAGAFDPTKYGSVADLVAGLGSATGTNRSYASELNGLRNRAKGNKTLLGFINTLAASGQTATLQTLFGASNRDLAKVSAAVGGYNASLTAGSDAATTAQYGKSFQQEQKYVTDLTKQVSELAGALAELAARPIEVSIDGQVLARMTDKQIEAFVKKLTTVTKHGRK